MASRLAKEAEAAGSEDDCTQKAAIIDVLICGRSPRPILQHSCNKLMKAV
jgi:hypothetical protein